VLVRLSTRTGTWPVAGGAGALHITCRLTALMKMETITKPNRAPSKKWFCRGGTPVLARQGVTPDN